MTDKAVAHDKMDRELMERQRIEIFKDFHRKREAAEKKAAEGADNSDDELPPPIPIDPDFKPRFAWELQRPAAANGVQPKPASAMPHDALDFTLDSRKDQSAPLGICFVPFLAVTKYCYKFVPKKWMQPLATAFFDADKIWSRDWDLYYINTSYGGVLTFITEYQLKALLDEINATFPDAELSITEEDRAEGGHVIDFEDLPLDLRPRFLGRCNSRIKHAAWTYQLESQPNRMIPDNGDRSLEAFKAKIDAAQAHNKNRTKASRTKRQQENVLKRQDMVKQGLRSQRYLGLIPKTQETELPDINNLSITGPIDVAHPVPHPFDNEPIFISIDVEAWEKPPRMVTEVGVATLDTRDLKGQAPGKNAQDWFQFIRGRHFRILEYENYVNYEYVRGCPDSFEFGESEKVAKDSIAMVLASCFREPFSKKISKHDEDYPPLGSTPTPPSTAEPETRNIVLVGHDLGQDVEYCQKIGYSILNRGNIIDHADTVNMYRSYNKDPNARSLGSILYDFDIPGWHLHNAGNDAVYTMQAMLAICVQSATGRGEEQEKRERELQQKREETLVEGAKEKAKEDAQGWESSGAEDGGVAVKPKDEDFIKPPKAFGPPRPPRAQQNAGLYTMGGAPLDV